MADSTEVYCLNAYDNVGNFLRTLRCWQPNEIWQDFDYLIPNIWNREVDYICYTDKCWNCCRLDNENELIIHSTQWEIKTFTLSTSKNCIWLKWSELYWWNWCRTLVLYKTWSYPTSISDWTIAVEELTKNQYCTNVYWKTGLAYKTTYYVKAFALDWSNNIIWSKCGTITTWSPFVTTCWWYTWAEQTTVLQPWTYKLEVRWAQWWSSWGIWWKWWYSAGCITLSSTTTLYIYVWGAWTWWSYVSAWWWNGWGGWCASQRVSTSWWWATDIRIWWNTLYYRRIVAWWGWWWVDSNYGQPAWVWWWCNWTNGYSYWWDTPWNRGGCWGTQTAWWNAKNDSSFWSKYNWSFWQWWWGCSCYITWWWWGWYWWWSWWPDWSWWWWSWYIYNSSTCVNAPSWYHHCTEYFLTNWVSCCWNQSFPTPAWWIETWHSWNGCIKISPV